MDDVPLTYSVNVTIKNLESGSQNQALGIRGRVGQTLGQNAIWGMKWDRENVLYWGLR
ncbi:hypothetical protein HMPREF3212_01333 [Citrobacter freundii]|nr:hypothetical protein HMPREF3212_01333 [Citrobacter freundii]